MITKIFATWVVLAASAYLPVSTQKCKTQWFDNDDPSGRGDYELLTDLLTTFPGYICSHPVGIEAQTLSGQPASATGNIFQVYNATNGFACVSTDQNGRLCADYKVRFTCPEEFCSSCRTPWLDRDNPGGKGDYETLVEIQMTYPLQVCSQPIAIEVTTISGTPAPQTGNVFQVYDPLLGFACVNAQQNVVSGLCQDYKVRFTCPLSFCHPKCTTQWFDRDNPGGNGDYELLADLLSIYPGLICPNPIGIEAQTISGIPASQTGNTFQVYNATYGFACVNADQGGGGHCADYRVRFTCPEEFCSSCRTPWFDRDNPGGKGDYETLADIHITYPLQVCSQPIAIEVTTISGTPPLQTGNTFQVYDPLQGFACVNSQQSGGGCQDYRVRFTCPKSFCLPTCVTQWFDRDNPGGNGDYELLTDLLNMYPGYICPNPLGIEAQTISGIPASQMGNIFQVYNPTSGFACANADQGGVLCADYRVRFSCPEKFCSSCRTSWIDRDDPGGQGDYETLVDILTTYPKQVCSQPIAIEVSTISGTPALQTGNIFQVYDPTQGFACVNAQQSGGFCQDYKVRFTCPKSFCKTFPISQSQSLEKEDATISQNMTENVNLTLDF